MSDHTKDEWSVWMARVMFDDEIGSKERPVIVLKDQVILCICMGVTSKQKIFRHGYKLKEWRHAGLTKASWVRFEYLRLKPDRFGRKIGMLHPDDICGIQAWMKKLMYGHDL